MHIFAGDSPSPWLQVLASLSDRWNYSFFDLKVMNCGLGQVGCRFNILHTHAVKNNDDNSKSKLVRNAATVKVCVAFMCGSTVDGVHASKMGRGTKVEEQTSAWINLMHDSWPVLNSKLSSHDGTPSRRPFAGAERGIGVPRRPLREPQEVSQGFG